jgi:hypothetical protein
MTGRRPHTQDTDGSPLVQKLKRLTVNPAGFVSTPLVTGARLRLPKGQNSTASHKLSKPDQKDTGRRSTVVCGARRGLGTGTKAD